MGGDARKRGVVAHDAVQLTAAAEGRRNAALREIERRRAVFAETLRRSVQQIETDDLKAIEATPAKGKHAA